ncbi:MAG: hypothetical protein J5515_04425, partial [Lachnospiraceae bacterium]|nr:hypothetical protein [Lachnospiraceae bacterium]
MADRRKRRKRRKKQSANVYKVIAGVVGASLAALIVLILAYIISTNVDFGIGTKTPGVVEEVKLMPTYASAETPEEWAMLEQNVPTEISQNLTIMMVGD